ncbi:MAG: redoxin domain-containing protein [Planctomycetes bacterium]|nr:redoxin domain-containing protein [Planctomycetota bacterium]
MFDAFAASAAVAGPPAAAPGDATAAPDPAAAPQDVPSADDLSTAEREWQQITDDLTPKLVKLRELPEEERRRQTLRAELARIGEFVRRYQVAEPDVAAAARVFMATQVLWRGLRRDREAIDVLRDVAAHAKDSVVAGLAAVNAGEILLKLGDEDGLKALREIYGARADAAGDALVINAVDALDGFCRQVRIQPGRPFPSIELRDLSDAVIDQAAWRGKLVVVLAFNVEATAAREALASLARACKALRDPALLPIGISLDRDRGKLLAELEKSGVKFPVDCSGKEWDSVPAKELGLTQIPVTIVVGPAGKIVFSRTGDRGVELEPLLVEWLASLRASGELPARPAGG